jgi:glycosyltransferase involved in cell wall biosynthesis
MVTTPAVGQAVCDSQPVLPERVLLVPPVQRLVLESPPPEPEAPLRIGYFGDWDAHDGLEALVEVVLDLAEDGVDIRLDLGSIPPAGQPPKRLAGLLRRSALRAGDDLIRAPDCRDGLLYSQALGACDAIVVPIAERPRHETHLPGLMPARNALAAGVPAIVPALRGVEDVIQNGHNGLLYGPDDNTSLRRALQRLVAPKLRRALREGARHSPSLLNPHARDEAVAHILRSIAQHSRPSAQIKPRPIDPARPSVVLALRNEAVSLAFREGADPPRGWGFRNSERVVEYPWLLTRLRG